VRRPTVGPPTRPKAAESPFQTRSRTAWKSDWISQSGMPVGSVWFGFYESVVSRICIRPLELFNVAI
jgi:hypothetical protein